MSKLKQVPAKEDGSLLNYTKSELLSLKSHPHFNENWLHERIKEDPTILGLGDLDVRDHERRQPRAGRLDLLLEDVEQKQRFEIEIQLGQTDESHLIRTIEYWDNERKRFPQYDHCAVIIAEDITTRFLNVINLFNGHIPLIAIQVKAVKIEDTISLFFTKIVNELELGYEEDDRAKEPEKDRAYWENKASAGTLKLVDNLHNEILKISPGYALKYNKHYIGLLKDNRAQNFVIFKPNKSNLNLALKCKIPEKIVNDLQKDGIEVFKYNIHWKEHMVAITSENIKDKTEKIANLLEYAFSQYYDVEVA